jgi:very-short-patch-repair endonuclease
MNSNSSLVPLRLHMRHEPTEAERALWRLLRHRQLAGEKFRRQHQIGPYILGFYCLKHGLVVEVDGVTISNRIELSETRSGPVTCPSKGSGFCDSAICRC